MIQLHQFQHDAIDKTRDSLRANKSVLLVMPCRSGKTVTASKMIKSAQEKGKKVWFVVHRDFLIEQTSLTFNKFGIEHGFIAAGRLFSPQHQVLICSVQTLRNRLDKLSKPDLIITDEAHHMLASSYDAYFKWADNAKHVGLTASPIRASGQGLNSHFNDMVIGQSVSWLIENGFLTDYKAYAPSKPDLTGVHIRAGDYVNSELEAIMDGSAIIGDMVKYWRQFANGLRSLYFAVSIKHSKHIAETFNASGIPAAHMDADTPSWERAELAKKLARKEILVLTNCSIASEGYDLSAQAGMEVSIECVGLARPTKSLALHIQQSTRSLTPASGKTHGIILDHSGNLIKHGLPDEEREWSLDAEKRIKKTAGENVTPVKSCKSCLGVFNKSHSSCPYCGSVNMVENRSIKEIEGALAEVSKRDLIQQRKTARTREELEALAIKRGYKKGWVYNVMKARGMR